MYVKEEVIMAESNIERAKADVLKEVLELGRREGRGKTARMALAEYVTARAHEGLISVEDAEQIWTTMMQGSAQEQQDVGGLDPKDTKQRASDIKHFIVLGANKSIDGVEVLDNAKTRMKNLRTSGAATGRVWELMLAFARAQNKTPERALDEHEIDTIFADKTAAEREVADVLWGARNTLVKANEGNDFEDIYEACDLIEKRVADLGGTRKQKRKAAIEAAKKKEEEKAAKKVARQGANKGGKGAKSAKAAAPQNPTH
jgi:hypothetical protein